MFRESAHLVAEERHDDDGRPPEAQARRVLMIKRAHYYYAGAFSSDDGNEASTDFPPDLSCPEAVHRKRFRRKTNSEDDIPNAKFRFPSSFFFGNASCPRPLRRCSIVPPTVP